MTGPLPKGAPRQLVAPRAIVVMGVAGSGKSTVGRALANALGWRFCEGDDHQTVANVAKMSSGVALTDEDRSPWLATLSDLISEAGRGGESLVVACSALKATYRDALSGGDDVLFVFLRGDRDLIKSRLRSRSNHFMGENMLETQFEALEEPNDALIADAAGDVATIVQLVLAAIAPGKRR